MKWVVGLFAGAFIVISAGMLYLTKQGVSIRTAPQIKPTALMPDQLPQQLAENLFLRLYPELQQNNYWWIGIPQEQMGLLESFWTTVEKQMKQRISRLSVYDLDKAAIEKALQSCPLPCWVFATPETASELSGNSFAYDTRFPKSQTLTLLSFQRDLPTREKCLLEKRVSFACLTEVAVNEVRSKLKEEKPIFFMRKYLDRDYFLFIEGPF